MDENDAISAVCHGDTDKFAELVERYRVGLVIYCERMLGDRDEAEDVAQKAFIKAYSQLSNFDPGRSRFSTWLYRIATNEGIDHLRKSKRFTTSEDLEAMEPIEPDAIKEEMIQEVRKAVLALMPPEQRRAIEAYYWEGKSCQVIADEMGVSLNTVKSWLRRAKAQLRSKLS